MFKNIFMAALFAASAVIGAHAQQIKEVAAVPTSPVNGAEMYKAYCAACHGLQAKGNGPAAPAMKKAPSDLTGLAKSNGGKFPDLQVMMTIKGDPYIPAHGSLDMPVWGVVFRDGVSHGSQGDVQMRLANLTAYIQSLQAK